MTKFNLKQIDFPYVSLNFADLHSYQKTFTSFKAHLEKNNDAGNLLKRYFRHEDKTVIFTPFPYSTDKERVSGYNDENHF